MARYVLRHRGGDPPEGDITLIEGTEGVTIHDQTMGALLIDVSEDVAQGLRESLSNWVVTPETTFAPPEPVRRRVQE